MKCEYCGTAIPGGAEECPACGAGITIQTEKPADGENTPAKEVNEQKFLLGPRAALTVTLVCVSIAVLAGTLIGFAVAAKSGGGHASGWQLGKPVTYIISDGITVELMPCPAGTFVMGSPTYEKGRDDDETEHTVMITKPFLIGKYEVTQKQWRAVMGYNPSHFKGDDRPVEKVSWHDAKKFCARLNELFAGKLPNGYRFDLPTEAQWEYACRSGTETALNNGTNLTSEFGTCRNLDEVAWYDKNSGSSTRAVGGMRPNEWGLYDMHGNVGEWCRDWYSESYGGDATDPTGPSNGSCRVLRGGSWINGASYCRSADRDFSGPGGRGDFLGFRLALVPVQ